MQEIKKQILNDETTREHFTQWFSLTEDLIASMSAIDIEPKTTLGFLKSLLSTRNLKLFK